jgi:5-methylcytosine-specific restriction enzyme subunit McrC
VIRRFRVETWGTTPETLSPEQAAALGATGLVRVEVGAGPGSYVLRGGTSVGVAVGDGWELHVESHLSVRETMFLLCYAADPDRWRASYAHYAEADSLLSAIAWGFASTCEDALRAGPLRGYRGLEESSPVLRGRLRVGDQIARGGLATPLAISRDEYDLDVMENRILLAAARVLVRVPLVHGLLRARLRRIAGLLDGVSYVPDRRALVRPPITRLNRHYAPALTLAGLIVRGMSVSARAGETASVTFAFELHRVFESFLETALGAALRRRGHRLAAKPKGRSLDCDATIRLYPDFVVLRGPDVVAVLDAKFKRLDRDLGADAYQLLAYLLELGPRFGALISAVGTAADRQVRSVDKVLSVRPLRLGCPPELVLGQFEALADECATLL